MEEDLPDQGLQVQATSETIEPLVLARTKI